PPLHDALPIWARTCSAYPPPSSSATTRSPVDHPVTASPTAAIVPDTSRPGQSGAPGGGGYEPARCSRSARFTPAEATCTTTSSGPGVWSGSVETVSFSGPPGPDIVTPRTSPRLRGRPGGRRFADGGAVRNGTRGRAAHGLGVREMCTDS